MTFDKASKDEAERLGNLGDGTGNILVNIIGAIEELQARFETDTPNEAVGEDQPKVTVDGDDVINLSTTVQDLVEAVEELKKRPVVSTPTVYGGEHDAKLSISNEEIMEAIDKGVAKKMKGKKK